VASDVESNPESVDNSLPLGIGRGRYRLDIGDKVKKDTGNEVHGSFVIQFYIEK
jgi:hypothetical protein